MQEGEVGQTVSVVDISTPAENLVCVCVCTCMYELQMKRWLENVLDCVCYILCVCVCVC